ncbi:MAG: SIMPL domain-containing protein [Alphaproteobacteria bacterium]|nr:SIMPL domain-containing protein [Alphaproteobacteria bacterium]
MTAFLRRPLMAGFVACAILLPALPANAQEPRPLPQPAQVLEITVQESVAAAPELAHIGAGVMTTSKTAAEAMQENAKRMTAVYDTLRKAGIAEKDMQTAGISLNAQYDYSSSRGGEQPRLVGYQASNNVNIIVRDLAALGKTLDAVVASGANQINGPSFDVKDRETHLDKARASAVANAKARAEIYAKAAGLKLRKIVSITEQPQHSGPIAPMMQSMSMDGGGGAQTPVAAGSLDIGLSALIRFELGE